MDPIKYIFEKPALTGKIARWQMLLSEYDIQYVTQRLQMDIGSSSLPLIISPSGLKLPPMQM
jgi:hypothetical protein